MSCTGEIQIYIAGALTRMLVSRCRGKVRSLGAGPLRPAVRHLLMGIAQITEETDVSSTCPSSESDSPAFALGPIAKTGHRGLQRASLQLVCPVREAVQALAVALVELFLRLVEGSVLLLLVLRRLLCLLYSRLTRLRDLLVESLQN